MHVSGSLDIFGVKVIGTGVKVVVDGALVGVVDLLRRDLDVVDDDELVVVEVEVEGERRMRNMWMKSRNRWLTRDGFLVRRLFVVDAVLVCELCCCSETGGCVSVISLLWRVDVFDEDDDDDEAVGDFDLLLFPFELLLLLLLFSDFVSSKRIFTLNDIFLSLFCCAIFSIVLFF